MCWLGTDYPVDPVGVDSLGMNMSKKHLKSTPHKIDKNAWWYEEGHGIDVVVLGKIVVLRWRAIRAALARKDKK